MSDAISLTKIYYRDYVHLLANTFLALEQLTTNDFDKCKYYLCKLKTTQNSEKRFFKSFMDKEVKFVTNFNMLQFIRIKGRLIEISEMNICDVNDTGELVREIEELYKLIKSQVYGLGDQKRKRIELDFFRIIEQNS